MYTMILVMYLTSASVDGGVAVTSQKIDGFQSQALCEQEGIKQGSKLAGAYKAEETFRGTKLGYASTTWSCIKIHD